MNYSNISGQLVCKIAALRARKRIQETMLPVAPLKKQAFMPCLDAWAMYIPSCLRRKAIARQISKMTKVPCMLRKEPL